MLLAGKCRCDGMNKSNIHVTLFPYFLLLLAVGSVSSYAKVPIGTPVFWWVIDGLCLLLMWDLRAAVASDNRTYLFWVYAYLSVNLLSIFGGAFLVKGYWEWKTLVTNSMGMLMPMASFVAFDDFLLGKVLRVTLKFVFPCFLFVSPFIIPASFGFYLAMLSILILFVEAMPRRWSLIVYLLCVTVLVADVSSRSNVIKVSVSLLLLVMMKLRRLGLMPLIWFWRWILIYAPLVLFSLGVLGVFNVFNMDEYMRDVTVLDSYGDEGEDLKADTRTFLYVDVLNTAKKYNSWLIGRTPAHGNETEFFVEVTEFFRKGERPINEAAILNVFTWTGAIGVFLYFAIFARASYLAIFLSNNEFAKAMGMLCAFNWAYSWVENGNFFNAAYFAIFLVVGMCLSPAFRGKNDIEMIAWLRGIFENNSFRWSARE